MANMNKEQEIIKIGKKHERVWSRKANIKNAIIGIKVSMGERNKGHSSFGWCCKTKNEKQKTLNPYTGIPWKNSVFDSRSK